MDIIGKGCATDEDAMRLAIQVAAANTRAPFGSVLITDGSVVAIGINRVRAAGPIWHGEIDCINNASGRGIKDWASATLATTAEPCPMCMSAIVWAGIGRVIYGTSVPTLVESGWRQLTLRADDVVKAAPFAKCVVRGAVAETDCDRLFGAK